MALPKILFNIASDGLGRLGAGVEKVPGLVLTGSAVSGKLALGQSYQIFSIKQAEDLGLKATGVNAFAYKQIADFYKEVRQGAELWIMLTSEATTQEQMVDLSGVYAPKLIADARGKIRILGLAKKATTNPTVAKGIDADSSKAVIKAEAFARHCQAKYMPVRVLVAGNSYNGKVADLLDYQTTDNSHTAMIIANNDGTKSAGIGLAIGRLARIPVQRSLARVKDGAVEEQNSYFTDGSAVEQFTNEWEEIHRKRYIFLRTFAGRAGFYFSDDQTLVGIKNDFSSLGRGLVMDEALIICYNTLVEELSGEVPITASGKIHPAIIKNWQTNVETQLDGLMVSQGKLSSAKVFIDENQNVLAADKVVVSIQLQPVGYAKLIEVKIGFITKKA